MSRVLIKNTPEMLPPGVVTSNVRQVRSYLRARRKLARVVSDICKKARAEFGPDADLALEVYRDPEIDDRHLVLYVRVDAYAMDIIDRIEVVCAPFQQRLKALPDFFLVTTDFRPPGDADAV
jgi:hypothetical protein